MAATYWPLTTHGSRPWAAPTVCSVDSSFFVSCQKRQLPNPGCLAGRKAQIKEGP